MAGSLSAFFSRSKVARKSIESKRAPRKPGRPCLELLEGRRLLSASPVGFVGPLDVATASVVGRHVFYNNSAFDGNTAGPAVADDGAIATDKQALLPGHRAHFENYTSYDKGINGIMIDVAGLPAGTTTLSPSDFTFRIGNNNQPSTWAAAPAPSSITVRPGAGDSGSTRIEIIFPDGAITKEWLEVSLHANTNTGLFEGDTFYFGNAVGESGDNPSNARVNATDEIGARNDPHNFVNPAPITNVHDYNRDTRVNATDEIIARNNGTNFINDLKLIKPEERLTFDDIAVPDPFAGEFVPDLYHGFNTDSPTNDPNFFVESDADFRAPTNISGTGGYGNNFGAPTPPNAASNDGGAVTTSISRDHTFDFFGAAFASFGESDQFASTSARTLTITGYRSGAAVAGDTITINLDPAAYHFVQLNFTNVDQIVFTAGGSTNTSVAPGGYFLFDNFSYAEPG